MNEPVINQATPLVPVMKNVELRNRYPQNFSNGQICSGKEYRALTVSERAIADAWCKTLNKDVCLKVLQDIVGNSMVVTMRSINARLKRPQVVRYIRDRMFYRAYISNMTEDKWKAIGQMMILGNKEAVKMIALTLGMPLEGLPDNVTGSMQSAWKDLGEAYGWAGKNASPTIQLNQQFNFTQQDGRV